MAWAGNVMTSYIRLGAFANLNGGDIFQKKTCIRRVYFLRFAIFPYKWVFQKKRAFFVEVISYGLQFPNKLGFQKNGHS